MIRYFQDIDDTKSLHEVLPNRAFLYGDAVSSSFYLRNSQLIFAEECYFHLMVSMRKMRMKIPLCYTLEFFTRLFFEQITSKGISNAIIKFMVYRQQDNLSEDSKILYYFRVDEVSDVLSIKDHIEIDVIREIYLSGNILGSLHVHSPENIYAGIYANENDLDDVILLNTNKRIARTIHGNILLLEGNLIRIPKLSEGAYASPLSDAFILFARKNNFEVQSVEMQSFETQKADEILLISETKGINFVKKIRNKVFSFEKMSGILSRMSKEITA